MIKGYEAGHETPRLSEAEAAAVIREYLGLPELELTVTGVDPWDLNSLSASVYQRGRVFCMGDAVHRHPPSNGLGSNTAIQDAFNLAWKIDLVLKSKAGRGLLESYSQERVPVGRQVVNRATKSMESYAPIINTILNSDGSQQGPNGFIDFTANTETGAKRRAELQANIREKIYEFQARGLELNQRYRSSAIIDDGQKLPTNPGDPELFYRHTTYPGGRLPHAWVQRNGLDISTLDLVGKGRFTLLTGVGGQQWTAAAKTIAARLDIEISVIAIGPGLAINDLYFEWAQRREIAEDGCLLVRPDQHIAWRCQTADPHKGGDRLCEALNRILDGSVSGERVTLH
jgi:2,4-dichlorophenol 6-monooxygenase